MVVTSSGLIHDSGLNSSGGYKSNDTAGNVTFLLGDQEYYPRTSAGMFWNKGVLDFKVFGWGLVVVRRYLSGEQLVWEYADGSTTYMDRIWELPDEHKTPKSCGLRLQFF